MTFIYCSERLLKNNNCKCKILNYTSSCWSDQQFTNLLLADMILVFKVPLNLQCISGIYFSGTYNVCAYNRRHLWHVAKYSTRYFYHWWFWALVVNVIKASFISRLFLQNSALLIPRWTNLRSFYQLPLTGYYMIW